MRAIFPILLILTLGACTEQQRWCSANSKLHHYAYQACRDNPRCLVTPDDVYNEHYGEVHKCFN